MHVGRESEGVARNRSFLCYLRTLPVSRVCRGDGRMSECGAVGGKIISQSRIYVTTDGQSASLSWCQTHIWGSRPDF
jgi:hypothetical protein